MKSGQYRRKYPTIFLFGACLIFSFKFCYLNFIIRRRKDLPLTKWSREEISQWEQRSRETKDIDHTLRRIPIEQNGKRATLIVKVYPAELEDRTRPREWSTGDIQLVFDRETEESRGLRYSRIEGGIPQEGILGNKKLKQGIVKTLGGTLEAWEKWLPAIDQLLEKSPVLQPVV